MADRVVLILSEFMPVSELVDMEISEEFIEIDIEGDIDVVLDDTDVDIDIEDEVDVEEG
jgi:hypothetical protein